MNCESNYQLAYSSDHQTTHQSTHPIHHQTGHQSTHQSHHQSINYAVPTNVELSAEEESFELNLSNKTNRADAVGLSFDPFEPTILPVNNIAAKSRKLFDCNFDAVTSSSSNQFFSNLSEGVIVKPKDSRRPNETNPEEDEFDFKKGLSSQISFDKF